MVHSLSPGLLNDSRFLSSRGNFCVLWLDGEVGAGAVIDPLLSGLLITLFVASDTFGGGGHSCRFSPDPLSVLTD